MKRESRHRSIPQRQLVRFTFADREEVRCCYITNSGNLAAAAAKINAQLQAKRGIQHVDVPPIRSVSSPVQ